MTYIFLYSQLIKLDIYVLLIKIFRYKTKNDHLLYGFFTAIFQTNELQRQTRTANKQFLLALEKHAPNPQKELLPAKKDLIL